MKVVILFFIAFCCLIRRESTSTLVEKFVTQNASCSDMDININATGTTMHISFQNYANEGSAKSLHITVEEGLNKIALLFSVNDGNLPQAIPKVLKDEILRVVGQQTSVDTVRRPHKVKFFIDTKSAQTAQNLLNVNHLLTIPVDAFVLN